MQILTPKKPYYPLLPWVGEKLSTNPDLLEIILLSEYEWRLDDLYHLLKPYQDYIFSANQRVVILHHESDYYPSLCSAGNKIYNFLQIIADLNISTDHIVILSNTIGLGREVAQLCASLNIAPPQVIDFTLWYVFPEQLPQQYAVNEKQEFLYTCLNGMNRSHRSTTMALLYKHGLENLGMISYYNGATSQKIQSTMIESQFIKKVGSPMSTLSLPGKVLRITAPFSRFNDDLSLCPRSKSLHVEFVAQLSNSIKHPAITGEPNSDETIFEAGFLRKSLVYLITESVGNYPYPFFTEKTWKAMVSKMPFVLVGAQHSLKTLKDWGFRTFSDFWDEGYDDLPNIYDRAECIVKNLVSLKNEDYVRMYQKILPTVEHNFNHLPVFREQELNKIKKFYD
jgi:hypothetical protein